MWEVINKYSDEKPNHGNDLITNKLLLCNNKILSNYWIIVIYQLCPWLWKVKEADTRILTIGKIYTALLHLPPLGNVNFLLSSQFYSGYI